MRNAGPPGDGDSTAAVGARSGTTGGVMTDKPGALSITGRLGTARPGRVPIAAWQHTGAARPQSEGAVALRRPQPERHDRPRRPPVADAVTPPHDLADRDGSAKPASDGQPGPPLPARPQGLLLIGLVLMTAAAAGAAVLTGTYGLWSLRLLSAGLLGVLAAVTWTTIVSVRRLWHDPQRRAELHSSTQAGDRNPQHRLAVWLTTQWDVETRPTIWPGLVPAILVLAIVAGLAWMIWHEPGVWEAGLVVALAIVVTKPGRRALPFRWSTAVAAGIQRRWRAIPAPGRATIPGVVLLNVVVGVALGGIHWTVFALMACVDFALLDRFIRFPAHDGRGDRPGERAEVARPVAMKELSGKSGGRKAHPYITGSQRTTLASRTTASPASRASTYPATARIVTTHSARRNGRSNGDAPLTGVPHAADAPSPKQIEAAAETTQPLPRRGMPQKLRRALAVTLVLSGAAWIAYAHPGPLYVAAVLALGLAIPFTPNVNRDQTIRMVLALAVAAATIDYVGWRLAVTNWQGWWIAVPLVFAEVLGAIHVLGCQLTLWPWQTPPLDPTEDPTRHPVFMFIPTLNEGVGILRPTLEGCLAARQNYLATYPGARVTIVVCNDGRAADQPGWAEVDRLASELGVSCVSRPHGGGAKAGNIENARQQLRATGDALLVIFDADQVPKPDFLVRTIPPFADRKVGWVQTGQYYANLNNPVARWADDQQSMFYNLLCPGKAATNASFICGTNVVIRAEALDEIGGLPQDSVTEDFAASIELHRSWRSVYLTEVLATGLGPLDVPSYLKQQSRWALGTLSVLRSHWRDILLPRKRGLTIGQRSQYFLACTHYLCGVRDLIYMIAPVLFIATGIPAVRTATLSQYLWHFLPYLVLSIVALRYCARGVTGLRGVIVGFGSFPALVGSFLAAVRGRKVAFAVTSKRSQGRRSLGYLKWYIGFTLVCLTSLVWVTQVKGRESTSLFISVMWVVYSLVMLGSFLWLAVRDARFHAASDRSGATDEVAAKVAYPSKLRNRQVGLHPVVTLGAAALIASPLLLGTRVAGLPIFRRRTAETFVIGKEGAGDPHAGVTLPEQLLLNRPAPLERDLDTHFSIVGRTQDLADRFDTGWAQKLRSQGASPWVTLEFGEVAADGQAPLGATLPAIANGVDDHDLARWAREIRDFGKPVYLTILLHVDKNWSVSSAVARGGIPQDVPRVWAHVQSVFHAAGANNVAWVWAPADPVHDQPYAPPASSIDAVLQSFINYPGTSWGDPATVLAQLSQRYPGKPIFVEASASGPPAEKAAWLRKLGDAVKGNPEIYALLYHEGGPGPNLTPAEVKSWSVESDPASLTAMKNALAGVGAGVTGGAGAGRSAP